MKDLDKLVESLKSLNESGAKREKHLTQFHVQGNTRRPMGKINLPPTVEKLEPGVYNVGRDMEGIYFNVSESNTDELLRFEDPRYETILSEVAKFWKLEENFKKYGFTMKRGILLEGAPGCGKSCIIKLLQEDAVKEGHLVFISESVYSLVDVLKSAREIEPDRNIMVVLEDMEVLIQYSDAEHALLELFDGPNQQNKVCYVGTTNYKERLSPRVLRSGRFDRKLEILSPPKAGRLAYLEAKLGVNEDLERLDEMADKTDGFSFGDLREFVVSVYCLEYDEDETIARIKSGGVFEGLNESAGVVSIEKQFEAKTGYTKMDDDSVRRALSGDVSESLPIANGIIAQMRASGREDIFLDFEKNANVSATEGRPGRKKSK